MRPRDHYVALDGLRGVAAISVLFCHLGRWQQHPALADNAGLAVDFFFTLSGYVLAVAYSSKLDSGMTNWQFSRVRLIRLMPVIVLGTIVSAAYLVTRVYWLHDASIDLKEVSLAAILGVLCIPFFTASVAIGGPQVFPLNGPQYTLFLELIVNWFWAAVRPSRQLWFAVAIAAAGYVLTAIYGREGDTVQTFWTGFPRVFGAYYAGVAIFCAQRRWPVLTDNRWSLLFWPLLCLTLILFWWPSALSSWIDWDWALFCAPLLVLTGSRVQLGRTSSRAALVLGELSYPVYALHYPIFVWVNAAYQTVLHRKDFIIGSVLVFPLALIGAWLILRLIDQPIRKGLTAWARGSTGAASSRP